MSKKVSILQSNYIPWKGYFDIINTVDYFVLYDTAKYTKNDWRNRNRIKTPGGVQWMTIPIDYATANTIQETKTANNIWRKKHWKTILQNYSKAKYFNNYKDIFYDLYLNCEHDLLSCINYSFIKCINNILNINTTVLWSNEFDLQGDKNEKLINICMQLDAKDYISGPSASNYLDTGLFSANGINITWVDYQNYPVYSQMHAPFYHHVSILDLIFNEGSNSCNFMKSFGV